MGNSTPIPFNLYIHSNTKIRTFIIQTNTFLTDYTILYFVHLLFKFFVCILVLLVTGVPNNLRRE